MRPILCRHSFTTGEGSDEEGQDGRPGQRELGIDCPYPFPLCAGQSRVVFSNPFVRLRGKLDSKLSRPANSRFDLFVQSPNTRHMRLPCLAGEGLERGCRRPGHCGLPSSRSRQRYPGSAMNTFPNSARPFRSPWSSSSETSVEVRCGSESSKNRCRRPPLHAEKAAAEPHLRRFTMSAVSVIGVSLGTSTLVKRQPPCRCHPIASCGDRKNSPLRARHPEAEAKTHALS